MKEVKGFRTETESLIMYQDGPRYFMVKTSGDEETRTFPSTRYNYASRHYDRLLNKMRGNSV